MLVERERDRERYDICALSVPYSKYPVKLLPKDKNALQDFSKILELYLGKKYSFDLFHILLSIQTQGTIVTACGNGT